MTLQLRGLTKSYGGFRVLRGVDLDIAPGEVHALLGPNGAGKSTLIKCLGGTVPPDGGTMTLDATRLTDLTPSRAFAQGIATIHQHLSLIDVLSVTDNVFLGQELCHGPLIDRRNQRRQTADLLNRFGLHVSPDAKVGTLPIGTKQLVEIAKAWHRTAVRVLILDEPTASLSEGETQRLFDEVTRMKEQQAHILYTTHRLGEVFRIADRVTVLRDGAATLQGRVSETRPEQLVEAISGGTAMGSTSGSPRQRGCSILKVSGLSGPRFGPLTFEVAEGEILGLYGVLGSGRSSLLETLAGRYGRPAGEVRVTDRTVRLRNPAAALDAGIALVPSDRLRQALWTSRSAADNVLLPSYRRLSKAGVRNVSKERAQFRDTARRINLQPADPRRLGSAFSGGNQQKLVLGRWLTQADRLSVLLLDEPTQGVDVGARAQIYQACRELAGQGIAIVFASSEAEEVCALADRALVLDRGQIIADLHGDDITEERLLHGAHQFSETARGVADTQPSGRHHP